MNDASTQHRGNAFLPARTFSWMMQILACTVFAVVAQPARAQVVNQYTDTNSAAITDNNCGNAAQISRVFNVPTSYTVGDVDLGVFAAHSYRSDLRITLTSPAGTTVTVMTWTGNVQSGDNLNDRFDDEAAAAIGTHNATVIDPLTPVPPPYSHSFRPSNPLSVFDGQNAFGSWTMVVCDGVAADTGTYNRADLFITATGLSVIKSSSVLNDGVSAINPKSVPGATVKYCIVVTNNGGPVQTNLVVGDPIPTNTTLVPATLFTGASCAGAITSEDNDTVGADESDPFGMSTTGTAVSGTAPTLASGATFAMVFSVTIN